MRHLLSAFILLIISYAGNAQQVAKGVTASKGQFIGFYEYKPTDYNPTATKKYPLIIFLHGIGERGNGTSDLVKVSYHAIPRMIAAGGTMTYKNPATGLMETFLVLSPQLSSSYGSWENFYVDEMIKYAKQNLNYDPNRVYLTGLSLGGGGTWKYAGASLTNAQNFAAIASVCPSCEYNPNTLESTIVAAKLGVWSFHAMDDNICSYVCSNYPVDMINNMKPATPAKKTFYPTGGHFIWEIVYSNPEVFQWFLGQSRSGTTVTPGTPPPANAQPPVANAGKDMSLPVGQAHQLTGALSSAASGIKSYAWTKFSGPVQYEMLYAGTVNPWIRNMVSGTYVYRLTVTDNYGATATDDVVITVGGGTTTTTTTTTPGTSSPVANAGKDESIPLNQATVLRGNLSTAAAGIKSYSWSKFSGPTQHEMLSPGSAETWIRNMVAGTYIYRLTITDNNGATSTDDVMITVGSGTTTTTINTSTATKPVANAGKDETIPVGQATVLNSTGSTAAAGMKSYSWSKLSGPAQFEMLTPSSSNTWIRNMVAGTYVYRLTVTDNNGAIATDDVMITVYAR